MRRPRDFYETASWQVDALTDHLTTLPFGTLTAAHRRIETHQPGSEQRDRARFWDGLEPSSTLCRFHELWAPIRL